jgi:hypothetical protein
MMSEYSLATEDVMSMQRIAMVIGIASLVATPACAQDSTAARTSEAASRTAAGASAAAATSGALAATSVGLSVAVPFAAAADIARQSASGESLPLKPRAVVPGVSPDKAVRP